MSEPFTEKDIPQGLFDDQPNNHNSVQNVLAQNTPLGISTFRDDALKHE
jgi:hypothetical protein